MVASMLHSRIVLILSPQLDIVPLSFVLTGIQFSVIIFHRMWNGNSDQIPLRYHFEIGRNF